ncbi:hypothetical protein TSAR_010040 [Trichomalopsis sarcophagae]|uniref:Uncharacterized protein n=1 Tax=Trichomalopsis sarcophagae TaxID=543379 RepID=A0A232EE36_9HYME|nr:hypothetical protein TSAR_010040 [Trichomalopsis sarcophagae]
MKDGEVVVEAATEEDRQQLAQCPLGDAGLRVAAPRRFDPRVIVYDLPSSVTDANLLKELARKNLDGLAKTKEVKEKRGNKARVGNVIVKLPNEWNEKLLKNKRLYVGWMYINVVGHQVRECQSPEVCVNCKRRGRPADHSALWSECPQFVWWLNALRKRVNG